MVRTELEVDDNESAAGRQQNRRVEVVISQADIQATN
jgi:flagellar motor protein MotB